MEELLSDINLDEDLYSKVVLTILQEPSHLVQAKYASYLRNRILYKFVDVNKLFAEAAISISREQDLWLLGLLLRLGADPNGYFLNERYGNIHQLALIGSYYKENNARFSLIFSLLKQEGVNENLPVFQDSTSESSIDRELIGKFKHEKATIKTWLASNGIFISYVADENLLNLFSLVLDKPSLFDVTSVRTTLQFLDGSNPILQDTVVEDVYIYEDENGNVYEEGTGTEEVVPLTDVQKQIQDGILILELVKLHNLNFIHSLSPELFLYRFTFRENYSLQVAVTAGNVKLFKDFVNMGCDVNYLITNRIMFNLRFADVSKNNIMIGFLKEMLMFLIERGYEISKNQVQVYPKLAKDIAKEYNKPKWEKQITRENSHYISNLARNLGLNPFLSTAEMSSQISNIIKDKETFLEQFMKDQHEKISKKLQLKNFIIVNKSLTGENPLLYVDDRIVYYNEGNKVYVFIADMFKAALETGRNDWNKSPIPKQTLLEMEYKLRLLSEENLQLGTSVSQTLHEMFKKDSIDDGFVNFVSRTTKNILADNQLSQLKMNSQNILNIAKIIHISNEFFEDMTSEHIMETLNVGIYFYLLEVDPDNNELFDYLDSNN